MKKSIVLTLTDEELIELERIMADDDCEGDLRFQRKHVGDKARGALEGRGHRKPWFEFPRGDPISSELKESCLSKLEHILN